MGRELQNLLGNIPTDAVTMHATVMRTLAEPDTIRRFAGLGLLLDGMTPTTADSFREAFLASTATTGRRHDNEWGLMLRQYGKVLGEEAMRRLDGVPQDGRKALEGWAIADPAAAVAWLTPENPSYSEFRKTMLAGVAMTDPAMAFQLVMNDPEAPMEAGWIVNNGVLGGGTEGVTQALQQAMDSTRPEAVTSPAFNELFRKLAGAVFDQKWQARQSGSMLPWLESLKDQPFMTPDLIGRGASDAISQGNLPQTLDWLDRLGKLATESEVTGALFHGLSHHPDGLAKLDAAGIERVAARLSYDTDSLGQLADVLQVKNAAHAQQLRELAASGGK